MDKQLEFWYEFGSTYSYPTAARIEDLARDRGIALIWRPFLLGPIFREQGWEDSPFNIYPAKGAYMWRDMERICATLNVPFQRPSQFPRNGLLAAASFHATGCWQLGLRAGLPQSHGCRILCAACTKQILSSTKTSQVQMLSHRFLKAYNCQQLKYLRLRLLQIQKTSFALRLNMRVRLGSLVLRRFLLMENFSGGMIDSKRLWTGSSPRQDRREGSRVNKRSASTSDLSTEVGVTIRSFSTTVHPYWRDADTSIARHASAVHSVIDSGQNVVNHDGSGIRVEQL